MKRFCTIFAVLLLTLSLTGLVAAASPAQDLNGDGIVDESDLQWLMDYLVGNKALPEGVTEEMLDLNGNGCLDIYEAVLVMQYIEGIIPQLPLPEEAPAGALKIPEGIASMQKGKMYRLGESFCGYGGYAILGEETALLAFQDGVEPITDGVKVYTNCFLVGYRVYTCKLQPTRGAEVILNPEMECTVVLVVGGTAEEREEAKAFLREMLFETEEATPEELKYIDEILGGAPFDSRRVDSVGGYQSFGVVTEENRTVKALTTYRDGKAEATETYTYDDGYAVGKKAYDGNGDLLESVTYSYHENGMPNLCEFFDAAGEKTAVERRDPVGNTLGLESYEKGVLTESRRFEYVYDAAGKVVSISYYYCDGTAPETLQEKLTWDEDGNVHHSYYYASGALEREEILYPDGGRSEKCYEGNGLLYREAAYDAQGELLYSRDYDEGVLMTEERRERETAADGTKTEKTYRREKGGEEYLAETKTTFPDGRYRCQVFDTAGVLEREYGETYDGLWWESLYENGVLREEHGDTFDGSYSWLYDENGKPVSGNRVEETYEGELLAERLEYVFTVETDEYLYSRSLYDENGREIDTYYYKPDGSLERRVWLERLEEDGKEIVVRYCQYGEGEPFVQEKEIACPDGSSRLERYEDGVIFYAEGYDAVGNFYFTDYEYRQGETGKVLSRVYTRYRGKGYYEACYREDGSLEYEQEDNADGSGYYKAYDTAGNPVSHRERYADGTSFLKTYYESGALREEYRFEGETEIFYACYDEEGNLTESRGEAL